MKPSRYLAMALRSSMRPALAVYWVLPSRMLSIAAWLNARGVMKSGSPTPREMQSFLVAAISKNFLMPEGFISLATGLRML